LGSLEDFSSQKARESNRKGSPRSGIGRILENTKNTDEKQGLAASQPMIEVDDSLFFS